MSLKLEHDPDARLLKVSVDGKIEAYDYKRLAPLVEDLINQHGKLDILLILHDFGGWTAGALWEDIKFDVAHFRDIGRLAIVGDRKWEKGMATFCKPFTTAEVRFFEREDLAHASEWVSEGRATAPMTS